MQIRYRKKHSMINIVFLVCIFCAGCFSVKKYYDIFQPPENLLTQFKRQIDSFRQEKVKIQVFPGQVSLLSFEYFGPFDEEELSCNGMNIPFVLNQQKNHAFAFLAQSYFSRHKEYGCLFRFKSKEFLKLSYEEEVGNIFFEDYRYPKETLNVDKKKVELSEEDKKKIEEENAFMKNLYASTSNRALFEKPFVPPLTSKITSVYGVKRIFNKSKKTQHLGTDFRAAIGTPIKPANDGMVVFIGDLFYAGLTVVVHHGLGIFTSYSHLSKTLVRQGDTINCNTVLGLSGASGRVNGPHLHWEVTVHGYSVDGFSLVEASQKMLKTKILR